MHTNGSYVTLGKSLIQDEPKSNGLYSGLGVGVVKAKTSNSVGWAPLFICLSYVPR